MRYTSCAAAPAIFICDACSKSFVSEGPFEAHMKSKKHVARVREILAASRSAAAVAAAAAAAAAAAPQAATGGDEAAAGAVAAAEEAGGDDAGEEEQEELIVDHRHCVFCFHESADVGANLEHMRSAHSFYAPDGEWLSDAEGYVVYLLNKVIAGRCLWCAGPKAYESPLAAQQHMAAKGHARVRYEEEAELDEYAQFYEYPPPEAAAAGGGADDDGALVEVDAAAAAAGGDLPLGAGRVARHRALMRYYRQRFALGDGRESVALGRAAAHGRLLAAAGMSAPADGSAPPPTAVALARAVALGTGTRGNAVNKAAQRSDRDYWSRLQLHTGLQMNDIRRKHFVLQTALLQ